MAGEQAGNRASRAVRRWVEVGDGTWQGLVALVCKEQANPRWLRAPEIGYRFDLEGWTVTAEGEALQHAWCERSGARGPPGAAALPPWRMLCAPVPVIGASWSWGRLLLCLWSQQRSERQDPSPVRLEQMYELRYWSCHPVQCRWAEMGAWKQAPSVPGWGGVHV